MADPAAQNQFGFPADVEVEGGTINANPQPNSFMRLFRVFIDGPPFFNPVPLAVGQGPPDGKAMVIRFQPVATGLADANSSGAIGYVSNTEANVQDPNKRIELLPGESFRLFLDDTNGALWFFANQGDSFFNVFFEDA